MGPQCPLCGSCQEMTEGELTERLFFPRTYICTNIECMYIWTMTVEELSDLQVKARALYKVGEEERRTESPDDWARLRRLWDSGEEID